MKPILHHIIQRAGHLVLCGCSSIAQAGDGIWTNDGSGLWSAPSNSNANIVADGPGFSGHLNATQVNSGNDLLLNVSAVNSVVWTGAVDGNWDTNTLNWTSDSGATTYADGGMVTFDDTAIESNVVNNGAPVSPSAVLVTNNLLTYAIRTGIAGSATLTKDGQGSLSLSSPTAAKTVGTTRGSKTVTMADTSGVLIGDVMTGAGIAANASITEILPNASVTLSVNATANGSGVAATLIHPSSYAGLTYVNEGSLTVNGAGYSSTTRNVNVSVLGASGAGNETIVAAGARILFRDPFYHNCAESFTIHGAGNGHEGVLHFLNSNWILSGGLSLGSHSRITGRSSAFSGTIDLGASILTVAKNSADSETWSARISGSGGMTLEGGGSTTKLTLTGGSSYTGPTTINSGILSVATLGNGGVANSPIGSASSDPANLVLGGGTLLYTGPTATSDRGFTLTGGTSSFFDISNSATTLTLSGAGGATTGSMTKAGPGTLKLSGNNSHSGFTAVSAGTLVLGASGSISNSSEIIIESGASLDVSATPFTVGSHQTLRGGGTVLGAVTVLGTIAPGSGSTLKFTGPLTMGPGSTTVVEIARNGTVLTSNRIVVSGALGFDGNLVIVSSGTDPLQAGDSFEFFNSTGSSGIFSNISAPPGYTFDEGQLAGGKVVVVSAPPPPGFTTFNVSKGTVTLAWPGNYSGWFVQSNSVGLGPNDWFDLADSKDVTSMTFPVDPLLKHEFFRMRRPDNLDFPYDPLAKGAKLDVAMVWSGTPVGFDFVTVRDVQIAAYYNESRKMVLAARNLNSQQWYFQTTTETYGGWDGHNYIKMGVDPLGQVHISANMHNQAMNYYRSTHPVTDASQFQDPGFIQQLVPLWDANYEGFSTYPNWFTGPNGEFVFNYRSHTSNNSAGAWHLVEYDTGTGVFAQATLANPLFAWSGIYSVYPVFQLNGGFLHCLYMWRYGAAETNFQLSYARSSDLVNWTDAFGRPLTLPLGPSTTFTTVDDVPQLGGLLNGQPRMSFDRDGVPLIAYHKYDGAGKSQVYAARPIPADTSWKIVQLTNSNWTWAFSGSGALPPGGSVGNNFSSDDPVDGLTTINVSITDVNGVRDPSSGNYTLDETTLENVVGTIPNAISYASPNAPITDTSDVDGNVVENPYVAPVTGATMGIRRLDSSGVEFANMHYYLRWETLPGDNRDAPKKDASGNVITPTPSLMRVYRTRAEFGNPLMSTGGTFYGRMFKPVSASLFGAMTRVGDSTLPFGSALSSPSAGTAHFAQWNFHLDSAGDYALGGSAFTDSPSSDSFWLQIDNGPLIDWRVSGRWTYQPVTSGNGNGLLRFNLSSGTHSLRLYAQEAGTQLAYLWLNKTGSTKVPSLLPLAHSGFTLTADSRSVSGYSLGSPLGSNPAGSTAHYQIPVALSGNYLLLGRTRAISTTSNSFYLAVNGGPQQLWSIPISGADWRWKAVGTSMTLSAGVLDLHVHGSEGGAELDSFMLLKVP